MVLGITFRAAGDSPIQNRVKFEAAQLFKTDICSEDLVTLVIC